MAKLGKGVRGEGFEQYRSDRGPILAPPHASFIARFAFRVDA